MKQAQSIRVDCDDLQKRLYKHVDVLAGLIGPRHEGKPSTLDATRAYIERELSINDQKVHLERFPSRDNRDGVNLLVLRPGKTHPKEVVILGAHYDTVWETPGADDNASAVACMLEVGRLLHDIPAKRSLRLIAFANEEPPHFNTQTMGSQYHASQCRKRNEQIKAMVCLEMVGYFSDEPSSQKYPKPINAVAQKLYGSKGNFIAVVSNLKSARTLIPFGRGFKAATKLPYVAMALPQLIHEIRLSDHGSFWDENYPALMVTDTSFFRNPHYHQPTDKPDTLNYKSLTQVTIGVAGAVAKLLGARVKFQQ